MTGEDQLPPSARKLLAGLAPEVRDLAREILTRLESAIAHGDVAAAAALVEEYRGRPGSAQAMQAVRAALVAMGEEWADLEEGGDDV